MDSPMHDPYLKVPTKFSFFYLNSSIKEYGIVVFSYVNWELISIVLL